jgi:uncharacterized protein YjbI with pentapeptide repeats
LEIFNRTPFRFAFLAGRVQYPKHSLTLVVKGTFDLRPDDVVVPVEEQPYPTGDEPYDDDDGSGPPRYENDFAPFKPAADLLLVGNCYPSDGPAPFCRATFRVGRHSKTVQVIGNRRWKGLLARPSEPEPFSEMPIRYERAFGGEQFAPNPIGVGRAPEKDEDGNKVHELPNLENPDRLIRSKGDKPDPVGFGPLGRLWAHRLSKMGTYDDHWKEKRFPGFPKDFDWSHFNAAPEDQHAKYLRGDEEISLENLHPEISPYVTELPGHRVRCFVEKESFEEVPMNLDTAWVDMDSEQLVLVWRGVTEIANEEYEDVKNVLIASENVSDARSSLEDNRALLAQALEEWRLQWGELEDEEEEEEVVEASAAEEPEDVPDEEMAALQATLASLQTDEEPKADPPPKSAERLAEEKKLLEEIEAQEEPPAEEQPEPEWSRVEVERRIAENDPLTGLDFRGLDLTALAAAEADFSSSNLAGVDLAGANLKGAILVGANLEGANLSDCELGEANFAGAKLEKATLVGAKLEDADFTACPMEAADLSSASLTGAILQGAQLQDGTLNEVSAKGADFEGATLDGARLESSEFEAANFSGASLKRASFRASSLRDSNWSGVQGQEVLLDDAELTGLRASGCDLSHGSLRQINGPESIWEKATLTEADFSYADLEGATFIGAVCDGATFEAADMRFAKFAKASLRDARLTTMNLFQGSLEKADLTGADLSGSNMYGVEFFEARVKKTVTRGTNLKMANQFKDGG